MYTLFRKILIKEEFFTDMHIYIYYFRPLIKNFKHYTYINFPYLLQKGNYGGFFDK